MEPYVPVLLCLVYLTQHNVFKVYPCFNVYPNSIPSYGRQAPWPPGLSSSGTRPPRQTHSRCPAVELETVELGTACPLHLLDGGTGTSVIKMQGFEALELLIRPKYTL